VKAATPDDSQARGGTERRVTRRSLLGAAAVSIGALTAACAANERAPHRILAPPTTSTTATPSTTVRPGPGPLVSGRFTSRYRHTSVGWAISYPPQHRPGDRLDTALVLHGYDADHTDAFVALHLQDAQAQAIDGTPLPPIALASVDGGNGYWHPRADGDDPQGMLVHEFLPLLGAKGLRVDDIGLLGWSMGGYGALLLAETYPQLIRRVAAESPAIWPSYQAAYAANPSAFDSAQDWETHDVIGRMSQLGEIPVRIDEGTSDPFLWGSQRLAQLLPAGSVHFEPGAHDAAFWAARGQAQLQFLTA
jgi:S-formylglutathione hydrolase FrmB